MAQQICTRTEYETARANSLTAILDQVGRDAEKYRLQRVRDDIAARCDMAQRIIDGNPRPAPAFGMPQIAAAMGWWETASYQKHMAAVQIVRLRANRIACKARGWPYRKADADFLALAADCREAAALLGNGIRAAARHERKLAA